MRFALIFCCLLLTLRGAVAQSFTIEELIKLRTLNTRKATALLTARGWHRDTARERATTLKTVEFWQAPPDTTASSRQETLRRFQYRNRFAVVELARGGSLNSAALKALLDDHKKFKATEYGSGKLRSGGCTSETSYIRGRIKITSTKYPPPPLNDGTTVYNITPRGMTDKEVQHAFGQL